MSEKRFGYGETDLFEWVEDNGKMISTKECVNKLNEQQTIIERLQKKLSECQGHKLELTPIPISRPVTLKEAEDSIRITKYDGDNDE